MDDKLEEQPQAKKAKTDRLEVENDQDEEEVPPEIKKIDAVQDKITKLEEEENEAIINLQYEYHLKSRPLWEKRQKEIAEAEDFWLRSMSGHDGIGKLITPEDFDALTSLMSLDLQFTDPHIFRVILNFEENKYFTNASLWKEFDISGDPDRITSCDIQWKDTKEALALKAKLARELLKHEEDGDGRGGLVGATPSFFSIFDRDERDFTLGQAFAELFKNPILYLYSAMDDDEADPEEGFLQEAASSDEGDDDNDELDDEQQG